MNRPTRFFPIIAAIVIQMCLGTAYVWSIFQTGVAQRIFSGDHAAASLTFSLLLFMLSIGSILGGKLSIRFNTRVIVIAGGLILAAGFFAASFVTASNPWLLWLTYGLLGGLGMGFTYSTTIACAQKWFPDQKGLVTGIIVSALGFGGVVFTPILEALIAQNGGVGVGEPATFRVLSLIFLVACTLGGLLMVNPPTTVDPSPAGAPATASSGGASPKAVLKDPRFYLIALSMLLACMGGLMMIGFAKPIAVAKGLGETATVGVLVVSIFNSAGRLFWGFVSDRLGRKQTLLMLLVGSGCLSLLVMLAQGYWVYVLIACIGFFYGGMLSSFPSLTADLFGARHMATNYGLVLIGFGLGAVISSYIAGHYKNLASHDISLMMPAFLIAAVCAAVSLVLMLFLKTGPHSLPESVAESPQAGR